MSPTWLAQRERGSAFILHLFIAIALNFGRPIARFIMLGTAWYFLLFSIRPRAASRKYLRKALGRPARFYDVLRHYFAFATVGLDRIYLLNDRVDKFKVEIYGEHHLDALNERGGGCLLLGAHLGSFEILRAVGAAKHRQIGLVMYEENARMVNRIARSINPAVAENVIQLGRFDSMLKVHEKLEQSKWIGILGDRALSLEAQMKVPFLGEEASFPTAPFRLGLMLKRPVILMLGVYRGGNRYDLHFETLFDPATVDRANREGRIREALQQYVERLEHHCRAAPYNWFNFYDFWDGSAHAG